MSEQVVWTEDKCTCGHVQSKHLDNRGGCSVCADVASWNAGVTSRVCGRYQWNGEERKRVW